jgi:hypothetical protein
MIPNIPNMQKMAINVNMNMQMMGNINSQNHNGNICINPNIKYGEKNNLSTGLSTNESNESFDSNHYKFKNFNEDRCNKKIYIYK